MRRAEGCVSGGGGGASQSKLREAAENVRPQCLSVKNRFKHKDAPAFCRPLAFSSSEFASDWLVLTMPQSAPQEGWREEGWVRVCVRVCVCRAPNTRGSSQRSQRAPKTLLKALPGYWDTVSAWPGLDLEPGIWNHRPIKMSSVILPPSLSFVRTRGIHTTTLSQKCSHCPPLLHSPEQLLMFQSSKLDLVTDRALPLPHARACCSGLMAWRRAMWL